MVTGRFAQVPVSSPGTTERAWQQWDTSFPALAIDGCHHLVVVAPHPDDEVLGVGGLMSMVAAAGGRVEVVALTDGEASHDASPTVDRRELAMTRAAETLCALVELGLSSRPVRLGLPDGALSDNERAIVDGLLPLLRDDPDGTWCVGPWQHDGHPDHDAAGRACVAACRPGRVRLVEYPVWMWHWAVPGDPSVPWARARSIRLPEDVHRTKRAAIAAFRSQIESPPEEPDRPPVLPTHVLERLSRASETVFV